MSTHAFAYTYDAAGNRVAENKDGTSVYYHYDAANQLTEKETVGTGWTYFEYDANGSMVTDYDQSADAATYFEYADSGLVSKVIPATGSPTQFAYDARLQRYWIDWAGTASYYAWDGLNQVIEKDASLSTVAQHTHGETPIEGIGSAVTTKRGSEHQYPHYDHRGSLLDLEDTGAADLDAEYNAFGEELQRSGAAVTRSGYQGAAWMRLALPDGTVLLVSPARIYCPDVGRFVTRDFAPVLSLIQNSSPGSAFGRWSVGLFGDELDSITSLMADREAFLTSLGSSDVYVYMGSGPTGTVDAYGLYKPCGTALRNRLRAVKKDIVVGEWEIKKKLGVRNRLEPGLFGVCEYRSANKTVVIGRGLTAAEKAGAMVHEMMAGPIAKELGIPAEANIWKPLTPQSVWAFDKSDPKSRGNVPVGHSTGTHNLATAFQIAATAEANPAEVTQAWAAKRMKHVQFSGAKQKVPWEKEVKDMYKFICGCASGANNGKRHKLDVCLVEKGKVLMGRATLSCKGNAISGGSAGLAYYEGKP